MLKLNFVRRKGIREFLKDAPLRVRVAIRWLNRHVYIPLINPDVDPSDLPPWVQRPDYELEALIVELALNGFVTWFFTCQGGEGHAMRRGYMDLRLVRTKRDLERVAEIIRKFTDVPFEFVPKVKPFGEQRRRYFEVWFAGPVRSRIHLD